MYLLLFFIALSTICAIGAWIDEHHNPTIRKETDMDGFAELFAEILPDDWEYDDDLLVCPHGSTIELDGRCPEGCISPLIQLGMI